MERARRWVGFSPCLSYGGRTGTAVGDFAGAWRQGEPGEGPVQVGERERLLETLHAWADTDGTMSEVARQLYRHRNTVTNHLRRVQELTGLSLTRPRDVATLVIALRSRPGPAALADRPPE